MALEELAKRIKDANIQCTGYTLEVISIQEEIMNIKLPSVYKKFLTICGKDPVGWKNWRCIEQRD